MLGVWGRDHSEYVDRYTGRQVHTYNTYTGTQVDREKARSRERAFFKPTITSVYLMFLDAEIGYTLCSQSQ